MSIRIVAHFNKTGKTLWHEEGQAQGLEVAGLQGGLDDRSYSFETNFSSVRDFTTDLESTIGTDAFRNLDASTFGTKMNAYIAQKPGSILNPPKDWTPDLNV